MRKIDKIIWHCSATPDGRDVKLETIREWHMRERGWSDIGYHYVIELDGTIQMGRPLIRAGAHVAGHNAHSIGICYVGGTDTKGRAKDTRTKTQTAALHKLTVGLLQRFPGATVHGHNEFAAKACPCFDVRADWQAHLMTLGIPREEMEEEEDAHPPR
jgi:N-acetylmuramoyl-L-alanine amidase